MSDQSQPPTPAKRTAVQFTPTAAVTGTPEPYRSMTESQLLQTIAVDSERTAIALERLLVLQQPSPETPAPEPDEPTTPKPRDLSLVELRESYYKFRDAVLNGRLKISPEDSEVMNRLDVAFDNKVEDAHPEQLESVQGDSEKEVLANGTEVPRYLIEVLNDFDKIWPGASFYNARPALVGQIITAQNARKTTVYPFCMNDDANIPEKGSPCVLKKGHRGRHKDNDDGSWA